MAATVLKVRPCPACTSRPAPAACRRGVREPVRFALAAARVVLERAVAIGARMQLDDVGAEPRRCGDRAQIRLDEERDADAGAP